MVRDERATVEVIIRGQAANATLKEMQASARALQADLRRLPVNSDEFVKKSAEFKQVNGRLKAIQADLRGTSSLFGQLGQSMLATFSVVAIMAKVSSAVSGAVRVNKEFEKSLQNLSAITGVTGKDLEFFEENAKELGKTVEGGARAVVEAYKLIGSAKPELLENKEALNEVTKSAILLAHASGLALPEAATRLTDALNQYGAPAKDAARYTDALAAAAKYGAAEVPDVTESLLKFGQTAKTSNINIYESAAAVELLAEKGLKGAEAGTQLKNIFMKMAAADVLPEEAVKQLHDAGVNTEILKDKTLPLAVRLKELSKISGDSAAIMKVFKLENSAAGQILIDNLPRYEELTRLVKESGVAHDQAAKNLNTFDQAVIEAGNAWDNLTLSITRGHIGDLLKGMMNVATAEMQRFSKMLNQMKGVSQDGMEVTREKEFNEKAMATLRKHAEKMTEEEKKIKAAQLREQILHELNMLKTQEVTDVKKRGQFVRDLQFKREALRLYEADVQKAATTAPTETKQLGLMRQLQEDIASLTEERLASTSRSEIKDIGERIKRKQAELDTLMGKELKHTDDVEKAYKQLAREIGGIEFENKLFGMGEVEQEFEKIMHEHQEKIDKINSSEYLNQKAHKEEKQRLILAVETNTNNKVEALGQKHADEVRKTLEEKLKEEEKLRLEKSQKEIDEKRATDAEIFKATHTSKENEIREIKEYYDKLLATVAAGSDEYEALVKARNDKIAALEVQTAGNTVQAIIDKYGELYHAAMGLANSYQNYVRQKTRAEFDLYESKFEEDKAREQRLYDSKVISKETYDARVKKLDAEMHQRKKAEALKAHEQEKKAARFQVILHGIEAIAGIWAKHAANPIMAGVLTGIAAANSAIQIATIESAPVPRYAKGGRHKAPEGFTQGAGLYGSSTGQPFIAGEAGQEYIVSNRMLQEPWVANFVDMAEAARTGRMFAGGGPTSGVSATGSGGGNTAPANLAELSAAINRLNGLLAQGIEARLGYDDFTKTMGAIEFARKASAV